MEQRLPLVVGSGMMSSNLGGVSPLVPSSNFQGTSHYVSEKPEEPEERKEPEEREMASEQFAKDCVSLLNLCGIFGIDDLPRMPCIPLELDVCTLLWILGRSKSFARWIQSAEADGGMLLMDPVTKYDILKSLNITPRLFNDLITLPHLAYHSLLFTICLRATLLAASHGHEDWSTYLPKQPSATTGHIYLGIPGVQVSQQHCGTVVVEVNDANTFRQIWMKLRDHHGQNLEVHGTSIQAALHLQKHGIGRLYGSVENEFSNTPSFYTTFDWTAAATRGSMKDAQRYSSLVIFSPRNNVDGVYQFGDGEGDKRLCRQFIFGNYNTGEYDNLRLLYPPLRGKISTGKYDNIPPLLKEASVFEGRICLNSGLANSPEQIRFARSVQRCYVTDDSCKELSGRMLDANFILKFEVSEAPPDPEF